MLMVSTLLYNVIDLMVIKMSSPALTAEIIMRMAVLEEGSCIRRCQSHTTWVKPYIIDRSGHFTEVLIAYLTV